MTKQEFIKKYNPTLIPMAEFEADVMSIESEPSIPVSKIRERIEQLKELTWTSNEDYNEKNDRINELEQLLEEQQ